MSLCMRHLQVTKGCFCRTWNANVVFVWGFEYVVSPSVLHMQEHKPIGTGHNRRAQPFVAAASLDDKTQVVSSTYNTPIGLYSQDNIQDAMQGQIQGLVHEKPEGWVPTWITPTIWTKKLLSACCRPAAHLPLTHTNPPEFLTSLSAAQI